MTEQDPADVAGAEDETGHDVPSRCGFVALLGAPNAGKSTLLNTLVGSKLSIVSPKKQTTRQRILGIATEGKSQIILVDTPGIFTPRRRLDRAMVAAAWSGAADADQVLVLVDAAQRTVDQDTLGIIERLKHEERAAHLVLNKIDLIPRERLLALTQTLHEAFPFRDTFMISALTGDGVADLLRSLGQLMPEGPWHFPEDQLSDMPMRLLASEITREQLYRQLHEELPYAATVETETWEEQPDGSARIAQAIVVQRASQKAIVIGKGGARIKAIGIAARRELEAIVETRVHLVLFVKVRERWAEDPERYRDMGLSFDA